MPEAGRDTSSGTLGTEISQHFTSALTLTKHAMTNEQFDILIKELKAISMKLDMYECSGDTSRIYSEVEDLQSEVKKIREIMDEHFSK